MQVSITFRGLEIEADVIWQEGEFYRVPVCEVFSAKCVGVDVTDMLNDEANERICEAVELEAQR